MQASNNNFALNKRKEKAITVLNKIEKITKNLPDPMSTNVIKKYGRDPFLILVSCLLSLRSRDKVTWEVVKELFSIAKTPQEILAVPVKKLQNIIYPIGFYKKKAILLHEVSKDIIEKFDSKVPNTEEELLSLKGIGRKTANLVLGEAFSIPAICVDTHVHKLANKLNLVKTKNSYQTEQELKKIIPRKKWIKLNHVLVKFGQNISKFKNEINQIINDN